MAKSRVMPGNHEPDSEVKRGRLGRDPNGSRRKMPYGRPSEVECYVLPLAVNLDEAGWAMGTAVEVRG